MTKCLYNARRLVHGHCTQYRLYSAPPYAGVAQARRRVGCCCTARALGLQRPAQRRRRPCRGVSPIPLAVAPASSLEPRALTARLVSPEPLATAAAVVLVVAMGVGEHVCSHALQSLQCSRTGWRGRVVTGHGSRSRGAHWTDAPRMPQRPTTILLHGQGCWREGGLPLCTLAPCRGCREGAAQQATDSDGGAVAPWAQQARRAWRAAGCEIARQRLGLQKALWPAAGEGGEGGERSAGWRLTACTNGVGHINPQPTTHGPAAADARKNRSENPSTPHRTWPAAHSPPTWKRTPFRQNTSPTLPAHALHTPSRRGHSLHTGATVGRTILARIVSMSSTWTMHREMNHGGMATHPLGAAQCRERMLCLSHDLALNMYCVAEHGEPCHLYWRDWRNRRNTPTCLGALYSRTPTPSRLAQPAAPSAMGHGPMDDVVGVHCQPDREAVGARSQEWSPKTSSVQCAPFLQQPGPSSPPAASCCRTYLACRRVLSFHDNGASRACDGTHLLQCTASRRAAPRRHPSHTPPKASLVQQPTAANGHWPARRRHGASARQSVFQTLLFVSVMALLRPDRVRALQALPRCPGAVGASPDAP
ncbi:hypothetical protein T440DRAFT_529856 [Plenodomus tracheiphilus IPT5]|uniref:Uncharacterized protein n=1 Tax=Plenodomus tracheiphilus IPT5 TaxID=1408161 RepID=A0A6A7B6V4_9PLEO|nr:hypothetical protein T440DRAFT_529856 [Plenodomus tracheiphilus IPT5]